MVNFGDKLKELRKERKLTQKQLADQVGVTVSTISSYESGSRYPSYDVLISLSRIFHVSTDYLLGLEKAKTVDVNGLSDREIEVIRRLVSLLKDRN